MTLLDYPGRVACTVFTGGCNLRCPFCHNAELVKTPMAHTNAEDEVLGYLARRRGLLDAICITGGEPLLQPDLPSFIQKVKALGYRVKLDTNGALPNRLAEILSAGDVDYVAMDIKSAPATYQSAIGCEIDFDCFAKSIVCIRKSGIAYEFRTTAVKGIHTLADFEQIANLLSPEDPYFIQGFVDSGNLLGSGCGAFSAEEMHGILQSVRRRLPTAQLRGQD